MTIVMPKVLFVQRAIPNYRLPFFVCLRERLKALRIDFYVTSGESLPEDYLRDSVEHYPWIIKHKNHYLYERVHIHSIQRLQSYDLVIVMQENSHLVNYFLLLRRYTLGRPLVAFFGHGKNLNIQGKIVREYFKRKVSLLPDWWFAYTALAERAVVNNGYPKDSITVVNNAIDDKEIKQECARQTEEEKIVLRGKLGINKNSRVALFCGRLMDNKVSFLIEALEAIREKVDTFEAIIIGAGALEERIRLISSQHHWLHYEGAVYGSDRAKYFCVSDVFLMPGGVGLAILDAFAAQLPIITTDCGLHGPEIDYLADGVNGFMTSNSINPFVEQISELLGNEWMLTEMKVNAKRSSEEYSIEKMADNFVKGIRQVLNRSQ